MRWNLELARPKIVVIGDVMLDRYLFCEAYGLTPEDPIAPKLKLQHTVENMGGAANVAANLATLGAEVTLLSVRGDDREGERLELMLKCCRVDSNLLIDKHRHTTVKTRLVAYPKNRLERKVVHPEGRYICRVDEESDELIETEIAHDILILLGSKRRDIVVVSDYNKGVVHPDIIRGLRGECYIVDPKRSNLLYYGPALVITPNQAEVGALETMQYLGKVLMMTRSGEGALLVSSDEVWDKKAQELQKFQPGDLLESCKTIGIPVRYRTEGDATGCGDSSIAGLAFGLAAGLKLVDAAYLATACGACAVDHEGIRAVTLDDVAKELDHKEYAHES